MSKSQKKLGKCKVCGDTLIIDLDDDFLCNSWGCFRIHQTNEKERQGNYIIYGEKNLVHDMYHNKNCEDCGCELEGSVSKKCKLCE